MSKTKPKPTNPNLGKTSIIFSLYTTEQEIEAEAKAKGVNDVESEDYKVF